MGRRCNLSRRAAEALAAPKWRAWLAPRLPHGGVEMRIPSAAERLTVVDVPGLGADRANPFRMDIVHKATQHGWLWQGLCGGRTKLVAADAARRPHCALPSRTSRCGTGAPPPT